MPSKRSDEEELEEACNLAAAIDLEIVSAQMVTLKSIRPATLIGTGKLRELTEGNSDAQLLIINHPLTPIQQRNLERELKMKVIDRTALILEIFGHRAQTREGVLQVELASLQYQKSRLVRSWTHLERQRGGFGFMGGPGEKQIESDRRIINDRIKSIERALQKVVRTRSLHRRNRTDVPYPIIALAGYTNAGKSTLFNHLTKAQVEAQDALFATLDPTMRAVMLPSKRKVILSDTVGFISNLPTELIAAFRATLEEVTSADIILHVRDISSAQSAAQKEDVETILHDLLGEEEADKPIIEALNKADLIEHNSEGLYISAMKGEGVGRLLEEIDRTLLAHHKSMMYEIDITHKDAGKAISWLHANAANVRIKEVEDASSCRVDARITDAKHQYFTSKFKELQL